MRKMTKTAAVLAAMSAMTVASASMAFAATNQVENIKALKSTDEVAKAGETAGTWSGDDVKGWKFTTEDGKKLKDTWAEIDNVWYYFDGETMAQDQFLIIDEKAYFFDEEGRLATGWQKVTSKMDAYSDIDIPNYLYYPESNIYTQVDEDHEYDYHDYVWIYANENGVAKQNEWFQDDSGLWYYFDGNVMVKNVFDYQVNPDNYDVTNSDANRYYGFDENGAMLVGWNSKKVPSTWNNPTADDKGDVWYYYKSNGQMQKSGWAEIDGNWYLFAQKDADGKRGDNGGEWKYGGFPLLVNSYVASYKNSSDVEYFYVDKAGKLQTGVQNVKKAWKVVFYDKDKSVNVAYEQIKVADKDIKVNFSDKNYAAQEGIKGNNFFTLGISKKNTGNYSVKDKLDKVNNHILDATSVFDNARTLTANNWDFTDKGEAVTGAAIDFSYEGFAIELPNIATIDNLMSVYKSAYDSMVIKERDLDNARTAWTNEVGAIPVTGGNGVLVPYKNLIDDAKKAQDKVNALTADLAFANAKEESNAIIEGLEKSLEIATAEKKAADKLVADRTDVAFTGAIAASRTIFSNYRTASDEYDNACSMYVNAKAQLLALNYEYFVNKWDDASLSDSTDFTVVGELVKNAFIAYDKNVYLADGDGDFYTNKAVLIDDNAKITHSDGKTYNNAYVLFNGEGKAVKGYAGTKKTIVIGGVSYWATGETVTIGGVNVDVFVSNRAK